MAIEWMLPSAAIVDIVIEWRSARKASISSCVITILLRCLTPDGFIFGWSWSLMAFLPLSGPTTVTPATARGRRGRREPAARSSA